MKIFGLGLSVTICLLATARADLTMVQKVEGTGSVHQITIKIKGDKTRLEISPEVAMLIDNKSGDILNLMNAQKKYMRISADKSKAVVDLLSKHLKDSPGSVATAKFVATGKKDTMDGYDVEEYIRESPSMKETFWIAPKYPDAAAILKQLQSIRPSAWSDLAKGVLDFRELPGLPLRATVKTDRMETTSSLVSVKQDPLNDEEFSVPKDFQEFKIPNFQDVLSEKSAPRKP
jgi:hypothetical protein